MKALSWAWFVTLQLVSLVAMVVGWVLLLPFCLAYGWSVAYRKSIKDERLVDRWRFTPLNWVYGNPEDGVSGRQAIIFVNGVAGPYRPQLWAPWRAYLWSGWRNSCNNLKYVFAWKGGPFKRWEWTWTLRQRVLRLYFQCGWYPNGMPVLSGGHR